MQKEKINGEVRISTQTFFRLLEEQEEAEKSKKRRDQAVEMLSDFLQFLGTKDYFKDIQQEFNNSHNRLSVHKDNQDGRVKIYMDGKKVRNKD